MYVRVKVTPSARKERVHARTETEFEMQVREPASRNLANMRVRELLADIYRIPVSSVRMVTGHHSPTKVFDITTL